MKRAGFVRVFEFQFVARDVLLLLKRSQLFFTALANVGHNAMYITAADVQQTNRIRILCENKYWFKVSNRYCTNGKYKENARTIIVYVNV